MIRTRFKKVLLVSSKKFPDQLLAGYKNVRHISAINAIFPSIHELCPDVILFDHAHVASDIEKVLRRLQTNSFYKSIKVCCYKQKESVTADSFLKTLGVHHMIYHHDLERVSNSKAALNAINNFIDASLVQFVSGIQAN